MQANKNFKQSELAKKHENTMIAKKQEIAAIKRQRALVRIGELNRTTAFS